MKVHIVHVRKKQIGFCKACYGCAETGVCVQEDDFMDILRLAHEADAIIAEATDIFQGVAKGWKYKKKAIWRKLFILFKSCYRQIRSLCVKWICNGK